MKKSIIALTLSFVIFAGSAGAAISLLSGGNVRLDSGWAGGSKPSAGVGTDGLITVDGIMDGSDLFGYGTGAIINQTAGNIIGTGSRGFNMNGGGTWNMSGGSIVMRYVLANGSNSFMNFSGGTVQLSDVSGNQHMGAANGGTFNVSGSAVLDGTHADQVVQTGGIVDIAAGWTGSWTWGPHTGDDWKNLFTGNLIEYNGVNIDAATFDSTFVVTNGGQTLALVPEPSAFSLAALGLLGFVLRRKR